MSRTPTVDVTKQYRGVDSDGTVVFHNSIQPNTTYDAVVFKAEKTPDLVAELSTFNANALIARGAMSFISAAVGGVKSIADFFTLAQERIDLIASGEYSDRGGERGANIDRFVTVILGTVELRAKLVGNLGSDSPDDVKAFVERKVAKLNAEKPASKDAKGKDVASGGTEWLNTIRKFPEYQKTQLELFPREAKAAKEVSIDDLFAD